jgi:hypothetical protein
VFGHWLIGYLDHNHGGLVREVRCCRSGPQHPLHVPAFNRYARPLAKVLVRNFEQTALEFYAKRAEKRSPLAELGS